MADEAAVMRDADGAEGDVITRTEGMHVDTGGGAHVAERAEHMRLGAREIAVFGNLDVAGLARKHADLEPGPFGERGVVSEVLSALRGGAAVCVEQCLEGKTLWRLHQAQCGAVDRAADQASGIDGLHGIGDGQSRDRRAGFFAAAIARDTRAALANGRAASWIRTISGLRAATASSPACTETCRVTPPNTGERRSRRTACSR